MLKIKQDAPQVQPLSWATKVPVDNIDFNPKKEKDNGFEILWETQFYPIFNDLMCDQSWLSLIEEELTWSEESSKKSTEKIPVPKESLS